MSEVAMSPGLNSKVNKWCFGRMIRVSSSAVVKKRMNLLRRAVIGLENLLTSESKRFDPSLLRCARVCWSCLLPSWFGIFRKLMKLVQ